MSGAGSRTIHVTPGDDDGFRILSCEVGDGLPLWVPVGGSVLVYGLQGGYAAVAFTTPAGALAVGQGEPRVTELRALVREGARDGVAIDPETPWACGVPQPLTRLPRDFSLRAVPRDAVHTQRLLVLFPDAALFLMLWKKGVGRLLRLPPGTDLAAVGERILSDVGASLFQPIVLVDSGNEPESIARALRVAAETPAIPVIR